MGEFGCQLARFAVKMEMHVGSVRNLGDRGQGCNHGEAIAHFYFNPTAEKHQNHGLSTYLGPKSDKAAIRSQIV